MATALQSPPGSETSPLVGSECDDAEAARRRRRERRMAFCCLGAFALFVLCNAVATIYRVRNPWEVCFATGVSVNSLYLFGALSAYDGAPPEDARRQRRGFRVAVSGLTTFLISGFSIRASAMVPAAVSLAMWVLNVFVAVAGLGVILESPSGSPPEETV